MFSTNFGPKIQKKSSCDFRFEWNNDFETCSNKELFDRNINQPITSSAERRETNVWQIQGSTNRFIHPTEKYICAKRGRGAFVDPWAVLLILNTPTICTFQFTRTKTQSILFSQINKIAQNKTQSIIILGTVPNVLLINSNFALFAIQAVSQLKIDIFAKWEKILLGTVPSLDQENFCLFTNLIE